MRHRAPKGIRGAIAGCGHWQGGSPVSLDYFDQALSQEDSQHA
jgi:hypothetical protein